MQRLLFGKIEFWVVALVLIVAFISAIGFGGVVLETERGSARFGTLGRFSVSIAEVPKTAWHLLKNRDPRLAERTEPFEGKAGWRLSDGVTGLPGDGFLLLSRFDGDTEAAVVELVDLRDFRVRHVWRPDADALFADVTKQPEEQPERAAKWNRHFFEAVHPILLPDGGLIIKDHETPLFRIDRCARQVWRQDGSIFHHSSQMDAERYLWVPAHISPGNPDYGPRMIEDGLARVSLGGQIVSLISLPEILERNSMAAHIFSAGGYRDDPLHLNDIEPVLSDGRHWHKGDLFLSLHHISMIALYRPSTDRIVWFRQGPWMGQHDVDILDDHRIAVFNNNGYDKGYGSRVLGNNNVLVYDFDTDTVASPFDAMLGAERVMTLSEGLSDLTSAGNLIVEEENSGRLLIFSQDGRLKAEYVNRAKTGEVFTLSWSRAIHRDSGTAALAAIADAPPCD